jgi:hypothetical protein
VRSTQCLRTQLLSPVALWSGSQAAEPRRGLWEEHSSQDPRWGYLAGTEQVQQRPWMQQFSLRSAGAASLQ